MPHVLYTLQLFHFLWFLSALAPSIESIYSCLPENPKPVSMSLLDLSNVLSSFWLSVKILILVILLRPQVDVSCTFGKRMRIDRTGTYIAHLYPRSIFQLPYHVRFLTRVWAMYFYWACSRVGCSCSVLHDLSFWPCSLGQRCISAHGAC